MLVGEEDEISIKEAAEMIVEAMNFTGPVTVGFCIFSLNRCIYVNLSYFVLINNHSI